jgi:hypothetical protein
MSQNQDELVKAFEFGSTYPSVSVPSQQAGAAYGAPTSNLQQLVTQALQGVLGRSFRPGDHASFKAALDVSFEYKRVGDKDVYTHKPRAYPAVGASDIGGGVSGAQFSLVSFASGLHEKTKPLIDDLHSLDEAGDEEELEAAKAIFSTNWDEFVGELSREGGPRRSRADTLAKSIFNPEELDANQPNLEQAGSLIRLGVELDVIVSIESIPDSLVGRIVFDRSGVVTSEEEGYLTNYIALTDYYFAVAQAWQNYRTTFLGTGSRDLGSGLLLIERALAVVEDGVNEVYIAMDSVNIDQPERLIIRIGFPDDEDKDLTVEDFLSWIHSFACREAPALIRDGGTLGIRAIIPTVTKLKDLTDEFLNRIQAAPSTTGPNLPQQFNHARVRHPLIELQTYLTELEAHATSIAPIAPVPDTAPTPGTPPTPGPRVTTQGAPAPDTTKATTRETKK